MFDIIKILFSKDFKDVVGLVRKSKDWRKDIVKYSGTFLFNERLESTVLIDETIKILKSKNWSESEQTDTKFILNELFENSFNHGMPSKEHSTVYADIIITSSFIKISLSDFGLNFDLLQELQKQEAFDPESDKHRALSLINNLTPEIYQEKLPKRNTIIVIKRQGLKPLRIKKQKDVIVFSVSNSTYVNDSNFIIFTERISKLAPHSKIVIDFGAINDNMRTSLIHDVRDTLVQAKKQSNLNIAICGLDKAPHVIQDYFGKKFATFNTLEEAIGSFK
jgi:anti-sigma regulatory factor (Ser/Thr protein kinase)